MINVCVIQDDRCDLARFERKRTVVQLLFGLRSLKKTAVD